MKLKISADGSSVLGLYDDNFPFSHLGKVNIERATNVIYDNTDELWYVTNPVNGERVIKNGFSLRKDAIKAEIVMLEESLVKKELDIVGGIC